MTCSKSFVLYSLQKVILFFFFIKVTWLYVYLFFHLNSGCRLDLKLLVSSICYTGFSLQFNFYSVINELLHWTMWSWNYLSWTRGICSNCSTCRCTFVPQGGASDLIVSTKEEGVIFSVTWAIENVVKCCVTVVIELVTQELFNSAVGKIKWKAHLEKSQVSSSPSDCHIWRLPLIWLMGITAINPNTQVPSGWVPLL